MQLCFDIGKVPDVTFYVDDVKIVDPETNMYTTTSRMGSDYSLSIGGGIPVFDGFSTVNNIKINRKI